MSLATLDDVQTAHLLQRSDYWRRSAASAGGNGGHKEWSYFCVLGDEVDLMVNLSVMDQPPVPGGAAARPEVARVAVLARTRDGRWHGDVEACDPQTVGLRAGRVDARLGRSSLTLDDRGYHLDARVCDPPVAAKLALQPTARPALTRSVPLGCQEPMHWLVVPRLTASGEVQIGPDVVHLRGCAAYHDHNWGRFSWGGNFAWEWGIALAEGTPPWSLVYYRITDRARHRSLSQGVLLWRGHRHCRTFRDSELHVSSLGIRRLGRCLRVPRIMSLAIPGTAADIPDRLEVEARSGNDALDIVMSLADGAQIGVPNDGDDELTAISEVRGTVRVSGHVHGETVRFEAPSLVEFNRGA